MYSKCHNMALARQVFDEMIGKDLVSWNTLILGYVQNGESKVALDLFTSMNLEPNAITYMAALKACSGLACERESEKQFYLRKGIAIHKQVRDRGFDSDMFVANTLVDLYSKCGSMDRAKEVFDRMVLKDVVSWTSLILGYVQNGKSSIAVDLFTIMDCEPDSVTYVAALKACGSLASELKELCLEKGMSIHKRAKARRLESNLSVANSLVDMYSKCGSMHLAKQVFDRMALKDVVSWTSLIQGYVQNGESVAALNLFTAMDCEPTSVTYVAAIKACGTLANDKQSDRGVVWLQKGIDLHEQVKFRGFDSDMFVANSLLDMYSKYGSMDRAKEVFDRMVLKDVVSWTSLIQGYIQNGQNLTAIELLTAMDCEANSVTYIVALKACGNLASEKDSQRNFCLEKGIAIHKQIRDSGLQLDIQVENTLVDMYSKCGSMDRAKEVFDRMVCKNVVSWTALILGNEQNGNSMKALDLFAQVDCEPDTFTYVAALKACGRLAALPAGLQIHATACKLGVDEDRLVATTLIDMYGKCGSMSRAEELFNNMHSPDSISWTSLIAGYTSLGDSSQVFSLVKMMQNAGLNLNGITFIFILTACSQAGLVQEGSKHFKSMSRYGLNPSMEHYNCMVDMLGRANRLQEALDLVKNMPFEADSVIWTTLMAACSKWKNLEVGKAAFDAMVNSGSREGAAYVLMSDIYRSLGMPSDLVEQVDAERNSEILA